MNTKRLCYISRNYYNISGASNKAKCDNEDTIRELGAINLGLPRTIKDSKVIAFFLDLLGILRACLLLRKGDLLFLQYPIKKYFSFLCHVARMKGAVTVALIHDIGSIRTHRLTPQQEVKRLSNSDYIIASNEKMIEWLKEHGMKKPMVPLQLFDYRSPFFNLNEAKPCQQASVVYAGALHVKKNPFLVTLSQELKNWHLTIYGNKAGLHGWIDNPCIEHKGFVTSDEFIHTVNADFGLVWDGDSLNTCSGVFGDYLRWNSPHKVSFYLRAGLPIIIWKEAAVAPLIEQEGVGIAINSLHEIDEIFNTLSQEKIAKMKAKAMEIGQRLNRGYFLRNALNQVLAIIK